MVLAIDAAGTTRAATPNMIRACGIGDGQEGRVDNAYLRIQNLADHRANMDANRGVRNAGHALGPKQQNVVAGADRGANAAAPEVVRRAKT